MKNTWNCEEYRLERQLKGMENLDKEFAKIKSKLEKQLEKLEEDKPCDSPLFYVSVKCGGGTEQFPIYCQKDLDELWEGDYIVSSRLFEKYENKLNIMLKTEEKRDKRSLISATLEVLDFYRDNFYIDIMQAKEQLRKKREGY